MRSKSLLALVLSLLLVIGLVPSAASADDSLVAPASEDTYVLMNIPYSEFYEAELADKGDADAVSWALEKKITEGTGDGKFSPADQVTLGHVVTFLYRSAQ